MLADEGLGSFGPNPTANPAGAKKEVSRVPEGGSCRTRPCRRVSGGCSVEIRSLAKGHDRPAQALVAHGDSRGRAWTGGQGGAKRAAPVVAGRVPDRGGLLLYPGIH